MNNLAEQLKFYNKTQQDFAQDLGVGVATVNRWLNHKVKKISRLAQQRIQTVLKEYENERQNKANDDTSLAG